MINVAAGSDLQATCAECAQRLTQSADQLAAFHTKRHKLYPASRTYVDHINVLHMSADARNYASLVRPGTGHGTDRRGLHKVRFICRGFEAVVTYIRLGLARNQAW